MSPYKMPYPTKCPILQKSFLLWLAVLDYWLKLSRDLELDSIAHFMHMFSIEKNPTVVFYQLTKFW